MSVAPQELGRRAERYAERIESHPVASREELVALLEGGGFALERLELGQRTGRARGGAGTHRTALYADFVARAPE